MQQRRQYVATAKEVATDHTWTVERGASVSQVPEPLSPTYRSRVPQPVRHVPEPRCQA
jgi:hypothetical protein